MPFNREKLVAMTATNVEYLDSGGIAKRLGVTKRTVEQLVRRYARILDVDSLWRNGRLYRWSDVLECAKIHTGITTSISISPKRLLEQQQHLRRLEYEIGRLKSENSRLRRVQRLTGTTRREQ